MSEPLIRTLDQVSANSFALVGGKGANLGELTAAGVPVPAAFIVTTAAYRRFLADNQLMAPLTTRLGGIDYDDPASVEASAASIRELLLAAPIPADVVEAVTGAYAALGPELS